MTSQSEYLFWDKSGVSAWWAARRWRFYRWSRFRYIKRISDILCLWSGFIYSQ